MSGLATTCLSCLSAVDRWCHITACLGGGRSRESIYETTLADDEREAVSDLLSYLENVCCTSVGRMAPTPPAGAQVLHPYSHVPSLTGRCSVPRLISFPESRFER